MNGERQQRTTKANNNSEQQQQTATANGNSEQHLAAQLAGRGLNATGVMTGRGTRV
ncbi:MAG: hypothetical protein NTU94_14090 [Planctomycetota bacterium]|nr:hypothetical protein [Planctomycetota bacterium]